MRALMPAMTTAPEMTPADYDLLEQMSRKYVWWKTPEEALVMPHRIIAQVMNIGDYEDVQALAHLVGDDVLRDVLRQSEIGQFNERSWAYWHYRLDLADGLSVPPMPKRRLG